MSSARAVGEGGRGGCDGRFATFECSKVGRQTRPGAARGKQSALPSAVARISNQGHPAVAPGARGAVGEALGGWDLPPVPLTAGWTDLTWLAFCCWLAVGFLTRPAGLGGTGLREHNTMRRSPRPEGGKWAWAGVVIGSPAGPAALP